MSAPSDGVVHRQHQLDNGLLISAEIDPQAVSAACGFLSIPVLVTSLRN